MLVVVVGIDLQLDISEFDLADGFDLIELVEKKANAQFRRGSRPLDETTLNHQSVIPWERMMAVLGAEKAQAELPKTPSAECRALAASNIIENPQLAVVLDSLPPDEALVARARGFTDSWLAAAMACRLGPEDAERVAERVRSKVLSRMRRVQREGIGASPWTGR